METASAAMETASAAVVGDGSDANQRGDLTDARPADRYADAISVLCSKLACPACGSAKLTASESVDAIHCADCSNDYPVFRCGDDYLPWLFPEPTNARLEWKARYNGYLTANAAEQRRLKSTLQHAPLTETGERRIDSLLRAREQHRDQIVSLLAPLDLEGIDWPSGTADLLRAKLPKNQGLSSYTSNIFRDWAWENGENEALIDAADKVLGADQREHVGEMLTLGAGACRLPYDLHRRYAPTTSVMLDFNPLLLQVASTVVRGQILPLYEFPVAPMNESSFAVLQECRAPTPLPEDNIVFVLADALHLPFTDSSFDTIFTPWLIDIIPQNLRDFIPNINRCLAVDGVWLNSGSLAFFHSDASWCYSEEEVLEQVEAGGFEVLSVERRTVPYLKSPQSSHGRTEAIFSFCAKKVSEAERPQSFVYVPEWILDTSRTVPAADDTLVSSSQHLLVAQVLSAVDGKRTIDEIGRLVAGQYGLDVDESIHAVRRILLDAWEKSDEERSADSL